MNRRRHVARASKLKEPQRLRASLGAFWPAARTDARRLRPGPFSQ
jgi:hypothetical protein